MIVLPLKKAGCGTNNTRSFALNRLLQTPLLLLLQPSTPLPPPPLLPLLPLLLLLLLLLLPPPPLLLNRRSSSLHWESGCRALRNSK